MYLATQGANMSAVLSLKMLFQRSKALTGLFSADPARWSGICLRVARHTSVSWWGSPPVHAASEKGISLHNVEFSDEFTELHDVRNRLTT